MADQPRQIVVCSCEDTIPLDANALRPHCKGAEVTSGRQLCRAELDRFRSLAASGGDITVACTQEAPCLLRCGRRQRQSAFELRQHPRECGLVARRQEGRAEDRRVARGRRRAGAGFPACEHDERRRHSHLWPRREGDRSGRALERSSRHHRADHQARGHRAAARHGFPGGEGQRARGEGQSRRLRSHGR